MTITPFAPRLEAARGDLIAKKDPSHVDVEIIVPLFVGEVEGVLHRRDAGVGGEQIEAAHAAFGFGDRLLDGGALTHIDLDCIAADLLRRHFSARPVDIGDRDLRPLARQRPGDRLADAGRAAGYDRLRSRQFRKSRFAHAVAPVDVANAII